MATKPLAQMGADIGQRMSKMSRAVDGARPRVLKAGAMGAVKVHRKVIKRDAGGDSRLSGVGKRGAKVGARFDIKGRDRVELKATGPLHLIERPTRAHRIPRQRKRGRRRYAVIPGVGVRAYANHPGTRAKRTWTRAVPKAQDAATDEIGKEYSRWIRQAFK